MSSAQIKPKSRAYEPRFVFHDGEKEIIFINSLSGVEYVYINGEEVYRHRKIAKKSIVEVEHDSNVYRFNIHVKSVLFGHTICEFYKNDNMISAKEMIFINIVYYYGFLTLLYILPTFAFIYYQLSSLVYIGVVLIIYGAGKTLFPIKASYFEIKKPNK